MLIFPNLSLTLEFPLPQFYHFSSSFFFIFLLLHIFYYFPSSILIFCLLHNYITIPPPSTPPHLFYIFFHPQIHRPHIDPTSTLDSTFFQHSFLNRETIYNLHHISIFSLHHHHISIVSPPCPHFIVFPRKGHRGQNQGLKAKAKY